MLNFAVGPVQSPADVLEIGAKQVPYFRTQEFSETMLENEGLMKELVFAPTSSRVVFLTGSGTAAMEAAVMNTLSSKDKALVVNGGSFGKRFIDLCACHRIPHAAIELAPGNALKEGMLEHYRAKGFTTFLVNACETTTGVLYDLELIARFCQEEDLFLIVDAVSSFLADPLNMERLGIDVLITGSQKALACPPGVSILVLSERALRHVKATEPQCIYFDLKSALEDGKRGQTPFTPAVGTLLQIHQRFKSLKATGGALAENRRIAKLAVDFRTRIRGLPLSLLPEAPSNALTTLSLQTPSAITVFEMLKNDFGIWICPNGGALKQNVFRVGHLGHLTPEDNETLAKALRILHHQAIF